MDDNSVLDRFIQASQLTLYSRDARARVASAMGMTLEEYEAKLEEALGVPALVHLAVDQLDPEWVVGGDVALQVDAAHKVTGTIRSIARGWPQWDGQDPGWRLQLVTWQGTSK